MKKRLKAALWFLTAAFLMAAPPAALAAESFPVQSAVRTGGVEARLYTRTDPDQGSLQPGESAGYAVTVKNQKAPAWIRVRIAYEGGGGLFEQETPVLSGLGKDCIYREGFLYCTRLLQEGEELQLCTSIRIPDYSLVEQETDFTVKASIEAVQDLGITPDFSKADPWEGMGFGDATPSQAEPLRRQTDGSLLILMETGKGSVRGGLFEKLGALLPGEEATETAVVENKGKRAVLLRLFLEKASLSGLTKEEQELLSGLRFTIEREGKKLYDNSFLDDSLQNGISLGYFYQGREALRFTVSVPASLKNSFSELSAALSWRFTLTERAPANGSGSGGGGGQASAPGEQIYPDPDPSLTASSRNGIWTLLDEKTHAWSYQTQSGKKAAGGWMYIHNPYANEGKGENAWFKFNQEGIMEYGWIRSENQNWYYCHGISDGRLGTMVRGWYQDPEDGRRYYLDPLSGIMQTGWRSIEGADYYFAALSDIPEQTWFYEAFDKALGETSFGKWVYKKLGIRSYGSLYQNEETPDGSRVDEAGRKIGATDQEGGRT